RAGGAGGGGIVGMVGRDAAHFLRASGARVHRRTLEAHVCDILAGMYSVGGRQDVLLVEERIVPEPLLAGLAYRGVPDVRVLVFRGVPVLAMLRLPTRRSDGRANLHLGGIGVGIDLARGETTSAVAGRRPLAVHPDLGRPLGGVTLPAWDEILQLAVRAADAVELGLVGVDLVVDLRRGPLVLELNARPGLTIQVANRRGLRPLLDTVAAMDVPAGVAERVALGRRPASGGEATEAPRAPPTTHGRRFLRVCRRAEAAAVSAGRDANQAQERAPHHLGAREPALRGDHVDTIARLLEPPAGPFHACPLDEARPGASHLPAADAGASAPPPPAPRG